MLLILFGLPAVGKNFIGRVLTDDYGFEFHDADDDLPADMRAAIQNKQIATDTMRDQHITSIIASVQRLLAHTPNVAIAGAFFKERHRQMVLREFPDAIFVLVETTEALQRERLQRRQNHLADLNYARKIRGQFEPPQHPHYVLHNDAGVERIQAQLAALGIREQASR